MDSQSAYIPATNGHGVGPEGASSSGYSSLPSASSVMPPQGNSPVGATGYVNGNGESSYAQVSTDALQI